MRLRLDCCSATTLPTVMVNAAPAQRIPLSCSATGASATTAARTTAAKAAALTTVAMNAVTDVGAPSYTSGVHRWNGTAATLNPSPTKSIAAPPSSNGSEAFRCATSASTAYDVDPVPAYSSAMP